MLYFVAILNKLNDQKSSITKSSKIIGYSYYSYSWTFDYFGTTLLFYTSN